MTLRRISFWVKTLVVVSLTNLQPTPLLASSFRYGFKGGETISWLYGLSDLAKAFKNNPERHHTPSKANPFDIVRYSLHGGLYGVLDLNDHFSLHAGGIYTQLGMQDYMEIKIKGSYVNIPIYCAYHHWGKEYWGVLFGLSFNLRFPGEEVKIGSDKLWKGSFEWFDAAIIAGVQRPLIDNLHIELCFGNGLKKVNLLEIPMIKDVSLYHQYFKISLGYDLTSVFKDNIQRSNKT